MTQTAIELAEHLADGIGSGRYLVDGIEVMLRAHIGLAIGPIDGVDATELIRRSSLSAARATAGGRPHARWDSTMTGAMTSADLALLADLRLASERGELWMAYQPQIDPETGATVAVEALIRWSSPAHGFVAPDVFIPLAERTGLVDRLTDWVLGETLDAQVRWRRVGLHLPVSVNVSAGSLSDPGLPAKILGELRRGGSRATCSRSKSPRRRHSMPSRRSTGSVRCTTAVSGSRSTTSGPATPRSRCFRTCRSTS